MAEVAIAMVRQVEHLIAQGMSLPNAVTVLGMTASDYDRWRAQFADHPIDTGQMLQVLEAQNSALRMSVADLALEVAHLRKALYET